MPKQLSAQMGSAVNSRVTRPGYFILIEGSTTFRWCTRGSTSWNGFSWAQHPVKVMGAGSSGNGVGSPSLEITDMSGATTGSALAGDFKDAKVHIWIMDGGALGNTDPVLTFSGAVSSVRGIGAEMTVTLGLAVAKVSALFSPRLTYGPSIGANSLVPRGTVIKVGTKEYTVERR